MGTSSPSLGRKLRWVLWAAVASRAVERIFLKLHESMDLDRLVVGFDPPIPRSIEGMELCADRNNTWQVVVTGNLGYEEDLRVFWNHCRKVGLCFQGGTCGKPNLVFYAEDPSIHDRFQGSPHLVVQKAWEIPTKFANASSSKEDRFSYKDQKRFFPMMSRRPTIVLQELQKVRSWQRRLQSMPEDTPTAPAPKGVLFCDLDVFLLQDPRPYFVSDKDGKPVDVWGANAMNSKTGPFNAGFLALKTTMMPVVKQWKDLLESRTKPSPNQISFNNILKHYNKRRRKQQKDQSPHKSLTLNGDNDNEKEQDIHARLLPTDAFPVGKFLEPWLVPDQSKSKEDNHTTNPSGLTPGILKRGIVVAFHNNWCEGSCNKTQRAVDLGLWQPAHYDEMMGHHSITG